MKASLFALPAVAVLLTAAPGSEVVTKDTIAKWMTELSNWGRWGKDDQKGTLNLITPEKRKQALKLVKDGVSVFWPRAQHR